MAWRPSFVDRFAIAPRALEFAARVHAGQQRKSDHAPFLVHPLEVASLLANLDQPDHVVAAGLLHDAVEDAGVATSEIEHLFGRDVSDLVQALSDDPAIVDYDDRKAALREQVARAGGEAAVIYAADKVAKVRELRAQSGSSPAEYGPQSALESTQARVRHYAASLAMLERVLGDHRLVRQLRFELEAYRCLSPAADGDRSDARERVGSAHG